MKFLCAAILLLAISSAAFAARSAATEEGYFLGRSGDVVITGPKKMLQASIQTSFATKESSIVDTQFQAAVMRQLGLPFVDSDSTAETIDIQHDIFNPARANLLVVVDGVTSEELNLRNVEISAPKAVRSSFLPSASAVSLLASMLTGATPREHGIVADKWDYLGETEHAYIHVFPEVAQIADALAQYSQGESNIVSASASPVFARALGVRPALSAYTSQSASLQFNVHTGSVEQIVGQKSSSVAGLITADLLALLRSHFRDETLLETPEHTALYAELAMILKSVSELSVRGQASARHPDLFSFAVTALNPIRAIHGTQNSEYTSALALVRKTIVRAIEKIQHAYSDKAIYEVLCVLSTPRTSEDVLSIASTVASTLDMPMSAVLATFPHINTEISFPCESLARAGVEAVCPHTRAERIAAQEATISSNVAFLNAREVIKEDTADETVATWLMFMFTWIGLLIITYFIWYAFYTMDIGEDSLLYRMTAIPNASTD